MSVLSTFAIFPSCRLRFARFEESRCLRDECDRKTFPPAVILNRFRTAFFVLLREMDFGISGET